MVGVLLVLPACVDRTDGDDAGGDDASSGEPTGEDTGQTSEGDGSGSGYDCQGSAPTCTTQEVSGDCVDAYDDQPATCNVDQWECPPDYHFEDEVNCQFPEYCDGDAPPCFEAGDCEGATQPASCAIDVWACPADWELECIYPCSPEDTPPDECWDQGPGECSDTTMPPSCTDGAWRCPEGWDFGGFGEDCEFPDAVPE